MGALFVKPLWSTALESINPTIFELGPDLGRPSQDGNLALIEGCDRIQTVSDAEPGSRHAEHDAWNEKPIALGQLDILGDRPLANHSLGEGAEAVSRIGHECEDLGQEGDGTTRSPDRARRDRSGRAPALGPCGIFLRM